MEVAGPFRVLAHQLWIKPQKRDLLVTGEAIVPQTAQAGSSDPNANVANLIGQRGMADWDRDGRDEHSSAPADMWLSEKGQTETWLEFDLGEAHKLGSVCIWNFNDTWYTDRGVRQADISVWTQETGWRKLHDDLSLPRAEGSADYDEPVVVNLDNVTAQKIRLDDLASFGDAEHVGLSKVQFFKPRGPEAVRPWPIDGAQGVANSAVTLQWQPGLGAVTHHVYLGDNPAKLERLGMVEGTAEAKLSRLARDTTYYWRIDELQDSGEVAAGKVWSFSTGGLVGWWKLDETAGEIAEDSTGRHNGAFQGQPVWRSDEGKTGGALEFDGMDDAISIPAMNLNSNAVTVSAWVKRRGDQLPWAGIVHSREGSTVAGINLGENNELRYHWNDKNWEWDPNMVVPDDKWVFVALVVQPDQAMMYLHDGEMKAQTLPTLHEPEEFDGVTCIGWDKYGPQVRHFKGLIDEVRIFDCALDKAGVEALCAGKPLPAAVADVKLERPSRGATEPGLVAWWKLDESEGMEVPDASGHNHTGALRGDARWQPSAGKLAGAIELDGDGDFIHIGSDSVFDFADEMTVAAWIKVNQFDKPWQSIVTKGDSAWRIARDGGENGVQFATGLYMENMQVVRSAASVDDGNWHHVAGVYDGQKMCLYVDGHLDSSTDVSGEIPTNQYPVLVGENAERPGRGWNGLIDDVQLYNHALTVERIAALYGGQEPETVVATAPPVKVQTVASETPPAPTRDGGSRNWIPMMIFVLVIAGAAGWAMFGKKSSA